VHAVRTSKTFEDAEHAAGADAAVRALPRKTSDDEADVGHSAACGRIATGADSVPGPSSLRPLRDTVTAPRSSACSSPV